MTMLNAFGKLTAVLFFSGIFFRASADTGLIRRLDIWDAWAYNYNASHWIEQGGLQTGMSMYGELEIPITSLPARLTGADWIQTAGGSRSFTGLLLASFQLKEDAEVMIAHNEKIVIKPSWLHAYTRTGEIFRNAAGDVFRIYSKKYHKNDSVRLGANGSTAFSMYIVIVKGAAFVRRLAGRVFDVAAFGARGDNHTVNTAAIQQAIDACSAAGGGNVYIHDGIFVTGTLELKDNVTLYVAPGSILRGSANHDDYPPMKCSFAYFRADEHYQLIYAEKKHHIGITGGGIIDGYSHGEGWPWKGRNNEFERPRLIRMVECTGVAVEGVSLIRSANWTELYEGCDSVSIAGVRVRCYTGQNNEDGIDLSSCNQVVVKDFYGITGDDGICLKAMSLKKTENIRIGGVLIRYANCHAVKIGTETHGAVGNIQVKGVVADTRYGIAVESVDGSDIDGVTYEDILMTGCSTPLFIRLGDRGRTFKGGLSKAPIGTMKNITIRNVRNTGIGYVEARNGPGVGSAIGGLPERKIENLLIENCNFLYYGTLMDTSLVYQTPPENRAQYPEFNIYGIGPAYGLYFRHVDGLTLKNVTIRCRYPDVRPAIVMDDVGRYSAAGVDAEKFPVTTPAAIWVKGVSAGVSPAHSPRIEKVVDRYWTFNYFPEEDADRKNCQDPAFDDSGWQEIALPHTWQLYETTGELHPFIRNPAESDNAYWWKGWGWYRKHFRIDPSLAEKIDTAGTGKKIFIEFDGVQKYSKVYINGHYLGDHKGGYGSFDFDITRWVRPGADNVLAVAVNNLRVDPDSIPPMKAGNWNTYGGIYRDARLVIKSPLYIPMQGSAGHEGGTFVTTPEVSAARGIVRIRTYVQNDLGAEKNCRVRTTIIDQDNRTVQSVESSVKIPAHTLSMIDQLSKPVDHPHLWAPGAPYVYKVYTEVYDGSTLSDTYESPLGFRWFHWDYQTDYLYVNDQKIMIHGGNRHEEYPWLGEAIPKWISDSDYHDMAMNLNYNFMRTVHYPNDPHTYDLTDRYGIVIDEELPNDKNQEFSPSVQQQQLKEMIRRERNHPSILFWSMGNETDHAADSKWTLPEDTTRIITARRVLDHSEGDYAPHSDKDLGIESLLRCNIRGWYNKDVKDLEPEDGQHAGTEENMHRRLIASNRLATGNLSTWLYADHGCDREYLNAPLKHVNPKGYVDAYRQPKYAYYIWEANYLQRPMVFILPHFWRSQYLGQKKDIIVDANGEKVELFVNNVSQGVLYPSATNFHSVTFKDIEIQKGELKAVAVRNGVTVSTTVRMADTPAALVLTASHSSVAAAKNSIILVKADIVDRNGVHVYGATNPLKWSVKGPATLAGPDAYTTDIDKDEAMDGTMYTDAPVVNVVRASGEPGTIVVTVQSPGLDAASVTIRADAVEDKGAEIMEPAPAKGQRSLPRRNPEYHGVVKTVPPVIKETFDEFHLPGKTQPEYAAFIRRYILDKNRGIDSGSAAFQALVELFASHMLNNDGRLVADDYNFNIGRFNEEAKTRSLPALLPLAAGDKTSRLFSVKMDGKAVSTGEYKDIHYAAFQQKGRAAITITATEEIKDFTISPLSKKITGTLADPHTLQFRLKGPAYLVVTVNHGPRLFLFAEEGMNAPAGVVSVLHYGADTTGQRLNTVVLQQAIDETAALKQVLLLPTGLYQTGSLVLPSNARLYFEPGAVLKASDNIADLATVKGQKARGLINILDADNVEISGYGIIDGNGKKLRDAFGDAARQRVLFLRNSKNIRISGITQRDPGSWNTQIQYGDRIIFSHVKLINDLTLSNTDGFDPDASSSVTIENCFGYCGDDNVAIKITEEKGLKDSVSDITVRGCVFLTKKSSLKVGTESLGAVFTNILFEDNDIVQSDRGMALYCSDGAVFKNIRYINCRFEENYPSSNRCGIHFLISRRHPDSRIGEMTGIFVRDCVFAAAFPRLSEINGFDAAHRIGVVLENFRIAGKLCTTPEEANIKGAFSDVGIK